jgi:hypothetical protein
MDSQKTEKYMFCFGFEINLKMKMQMYVVNAKYNVKLKSIITVYGVLDLKLDFCSDN